MTNTELGIKVARLVGRIYYATLEDRIVWEIAFDDVSFATRLDDNFLEFSSRDNDGQVPFDLRVWRNGTLTETFSSDEFHEAELQMGSLYNLIQRKMRGADKVVDDLLNLLPAPPEEGQPPF